MPGTWPEIVRIGNVELTGGMMRLVDLLVVHLLAVSEEETLLIGSMRYA